MVICRTLHPTTIKHTFSQACSGFFTKIFIKKANGNFPGGTVVKNLPANAGDTGLIPGLGRSHMPQSK